MEWLGSCTQHSDCAQTVEDAKVGGSGMFCHKGGFCDTCPFCQDDAGDAIDGRCPRASCPRSGGLPACLDAVRLASYVNAGLAGVLYVCGGIQ